MRVRWTTPALKQLDEIQDYIARNNPTAAFRLTSEIVTRTEAILSENPAAGRRGKIPGTRELVLSGTAYIVVYHMDDAVEVVAVEHGARDRSNRIH